MSLFALRNHVSCSFQTQSFNGCTSSVGRIFERGGPENLRMMKTRMKNFQPKPSLFSCPKLGEDQKKKVFTQI